MRSWVLEPSPNEINYSGEILLLAVALSAFQGFQWRYFGASDSAEKDSTEDVAGATRPAG